MNRQPLGRGWNEHGPACVPDASVTLADLWRESTHVDGRQMLANGEQIKLPRALNGEPPRRGVELGKNVGDVRVDSAWTQEDRPSDFATGQTICN